jgi:hypothetical protein
MMPFRGGVSNQKMAVAALIQAAQAEGRPVILPRLIDYRPGRSDHPHRDFEEIFDLEELKVSMTVAIEAGDGELLHPNPLFGEFSLSVVAAQEAGRLAEHPCVRLIAAMRPRSDIGDLVDSAFERFRGEGGEIVGQMRVEPDWQAYMRDHLVPRLGDSQDLGTDPLSIAHKVVATIGAGRGPVLVTCDPAGLPDTPEALARRIRRECGLEIIFKHQLIGSCSSESALEASLVDFELMVRADTIFGTTLSSFFGVAAQTHLVRRGAAPEAWAYNAPGPRMALRTDNGAFANLQRATAGR